MKKHEIIEIIENSITREKISSRGGGIEISLGNFGYENHFMSAYQNYLGGGLLGSVQSDCSLFYNNVRYNRKKIEQISNILKEYFFNLTNPETECDCQTFQQNQNLPISNY